MHLSAWLTAHLLFNILDEVDFFRKRDKVVQFLDLGACDINGNLKDAFLTSTLRNSIDMQYTGADLSTCPNVNLVIPSNDWVFRDNSFDVVLSFSMMEHDDFFWESFRSMSRSVSFGGLLIINVPSSEKMHR